jgi:hypothetical protein
LEFYYGKLKQKWRGDEKQGQKKNQGKERTKEKIKKT